MRRSLLGTKLCAFGLAPVRFRAFLMFISRGAALPLAGRRRPLPASSDSVDLHRALRHWNRLDLI